MARAVANNIPLKAPTKGMITNQSTYTLPPDAWTYLENLSCDDIEGLLTSRNNIYRNAVSTDAVLSGLTSFQGVGALESGASFWFIAKSGTDMLRVTPNTGASGITKTAGLFSSGTGDYARFSNVAGLLYFTYGETNLVRWTADGISATTQAVFPTGFAPDIISAGYNSRFWGADSTGFNGIGKVIYSNVIDSTSLVTIQATTAAASNWIALNTRGKNITALQEFDNVLYAFTNDSVFRIYNPQSADNSPIANVGTYSQETVVPHTSAVFFLGPSGVFKMKGADVKRISSPIDNFLKAINQSAETRQGVARQRHNTCFGWADDQNVYFSVGLKPNLAGTTFQTKTIVLKFNVESERWSTLSLQNFKVQGAVTAYPSNLTGQTLDINPITCLIGSNQSDSEIRIGQFNTPNFTMSKPMANNYFPLGDWSKLDTGTTGSNTKDAFNQSIYCHGETGWWYGDDENKLKQINGLSIASDNAAGFNLYYQIDKNENDASDSQNAVWQTIQGSISDDYVTFFRQFKSEDFYRIRFKISGDTLGGIPVKVGQITFLQVTDKGYGKD